jgi:hypothetical protein
MKISQYSRCIYLEYKNREPRVLGYVSFDLFAKEINFLDNKDELIHFFFEENGRPLHAFKIKDDCWSNPIIAFFADSYHIFSSLDMGYIISLIRARERRTLLLSKKL